MMMIACAVVTTVIGAAVILLRRASGTPTPNSAEDELPTAAESPTDSTPVL